MEQFADRTPLETISYRSEKTRSDAMSAARTRAEELTKETGRRHSFRHATKLERDVYEVFAIDIEPIEAAVAPLKSEAIDRAEKDARETVEKCRQELEAAGGNLSQVAPYPNYQKLGYGTMAYALADYRYRLFSAITKWRKASYSSREDHYGDINPAMVEKFVARRKAEAGEQYDAFVAKLISKIGNAKTAEIAGTHVWGFSILTVTKLDGTVERWKTQQIVNVSKLGKYFNQWPTRKVK